MRAGTALHAALEALRPHRVQAETGELEGVKGEPTYQQVADYYRGRLGTDDGRKVHQAIADGAGLGRGTRERKTFLRALERWRAGAGLGPAWRRALPALPKPKRRRWVTRKRSLRRVLALIEEDGVTVVGFAGWVRISDDLRWRAVRDVSIAPELLEDEGFFVPASAGEWGVAAFAFFNAWGSAWVNQGEEPFYVDIEEVEELELRIGQ